MSDVPQSEIMDALLLIKEFISVQSPYLAVYAALGGAFVGGLSNIVPEWIRDNRNHRKERKSLDLQLYAEIRALIEIIKQRRYIEFVDEIIDSLRKNEVEQHTLKIDVSDWRFPVYRANLTRLGIADMDIQVNIVKFYQLLEAAILDVKPGGILNTEGGGVERFEELKRIVVSALDAGGNVISHIEKKYNVTK